MHLHNTKQVLETLNCVAIKSIVLNSILRDDNDNKNNNNVITATTTVVNPAAKY